MNDHDRVVTSEKGALHIRSLQAGVSHFRVTGVLDEALVGPICEEGARISKAGGGIALHDWSAMTGYTSEARRQLTDWMLKNRSGFDLVMVLVSSSIVAMGVNVANLALGGFLRGTTSQAEFDDAMQHHVHHR